MKLERPLPLEPRAATLAVSQDAAAAPVFVAEPARSSLALDLRDLWEYRELLTFLVWRDVKVRYKQTVLGVAWAVMQPLLTTLAFTIFFGNLGKLPSNGLPYALFAFVALLPWQLFTYALTAGSISLVQNGHLLTKVFFPRLLVPLAAILVGVIDFCVSCGVLLLLLLYFQVPPTWNLLALPLLVVLVLGVALAGALWLAPLCVRFRDVQIVVPFLVQFWLFVTPVAYSTTLVPDRWQWLYALNPMVGVIEGFRWALLDQPGPIGRWLAVGGTVTVVLLIGGLAYFRRTEATFADVI